jgi:hypothetical protein
MGLGIDTVGPAPVVRLQAAGLKVASLLLRPDISFSSLVQEL